MGQQNSGAQFDQLTDEKLAAIIIGEITGLETQGIRLSESWRDQIISLGYLDSLLETALRQLKAVP